jgi:hypothetical protein
MMLSDDYTELEPGAVEQLEKELQSSAKQTYHFGEVLTDGLQGLITGIMQSFRRIYASITTLASTTPAQPAISLLTSTPGVTTGTSPCHYAPGSQDIPHLLLCIDQGRSATPLFQERLGYVSTDRQLFSFLRSEYFRHWNARPWFTLRSIATISLTRV